MPLTVKKEDPETGDVEVRRRFALKRHWFSLDQTEGPPFSVELTAPAWDAATALAQLDIREVPFEHIDGNVQGYATGRTMALNPLSTLKHTTRFHELAHVVLGHTESGMRVDSAALDRTVEEVEAEGTAYLLCATLGLPGLDDSRAYVQHWLSGRPLPERTRAASSPPLTAFSAPARPSRCQRPPREPGPRPVRAPPERLLLALKGTRAGRPRCTGAARGPVRLPHCLERC